MLKQPEDLTIREARDIMRPKLQDGIICLCCGQRAQIYCRPLTSSMCFGLILLYQKTQNLERNSDDNRYIHIENYFKAIPDLPSSIRGDCPKLRFWGLIEQMDAGKEDGNPNSGYYKITDFGKRFVDLKERVMPVVKLYNNKFFGFKKDMKPISIVDALKKKFDYKEVMGLKDEVFINNNF